MLRRKLIKKGLAKVMALTLAVSMATPGTALAAATQQEPAEEAATEESAEEAATEESAEEALSGNEDAAEEPAPADAEAAAEADEAEPAAAAAAEATVTDPAAAEPAATEPAEEEAPASQEDAAEPAAASPEMNRVTNVKVDLNDCTRLLGLNGVTTYQFKYEVIYDPSTSYEPLTATVWSQRSGPVTVLSVYIRNLLKMTGGMKMSVCGPERVLTYMRICIPSSST